jgi:hypothetical protein
MHFLFIFFYSVTGWLILKVSRCGKSPQRRTYCKLDIQVSYLSSIAIRDYVATMCWYETGLVMPIPLHVNIMPCTHAHSP